MDGAPHEHHVQMKRQQHCVVDLPGFNCCVQVPKKQIELNHELASSQEEHEAVQARSIITQTSGEGHWRFGKPEVKLSKAQPCYADQLNLMVCVCVKKHVQNLELLTVLHLLMRDQDFQSLMPDTYSTSIAASGPSHFLMPIRPSTSFSFLSSCPTSFWSKEMQTKINWHLLLTVIIRDSAIEEFTLKIHYVHWPSSIWNRHRSIQVPQAVFGPHPAKEKLKCCQNNGPHITQTIGSHHWGNAHPQFT